jgi:hypothetical protein
MLFPLSSSLTPIAGARNPKACRSPYGRRGRHDDTGPGADLGLAKVDQREERIRQSGAVA